MNNQFDILIVEDEKVVNESAAKILRLEGFTVDQAFDGEAALAKVENNSYRLVITDLMLKEISGINIIELINKKYQHIPVIMITGYATIINVFDAFKMGAFDYIPKPFTFDELLCVVTRAIEYSKNQKIVDDANQYFINNAPGKNRNRLYLMGNHSWLYFEDDGSALIGIGKTFATIIKSLTDIEFSSQGEEIIQGNSFFQLVCSDNFSYRIWAPLSGIIIGNNAGISGNDDIIKSEKYINQWFTRIKPDNIDKELVHLTPFVGE